MSASERMSLLISPSALANAVASPTPAPGASRGDGSGGGAARTGACCPGALPP